jgi:hypothetical protein
LGTLTRGSQVTGAGIVFENIYDIDFTSPYNAQGFPNRLKIPNFNANNVLINYTITKRELVVNGITKVFKRVITPNDVKPFFELFLPEKNVLGITSVLLKSGTEYTNIAISDIQHEAGRTDIYQQPNPSYMQINCVALSGQTLPFDINDSLVLQVKNTSGTFVNIFGYIRNINFINFTFCYFFF